MEIARKLIMINTSKSIILLILLLCTDSSYSAEIPFYIVTSAVLSASEISSNIFFSSLNSAIEDAITNTSKIFSKNFTIYLSNKDTEQTTSSFFANKIIPDGENSLNITVIALPCTTNDTSLEPYLAHCTEKRPKILFKDYGYSVGFGITSNITMIGFDATVDPISSPYWKFYLYCGVKDCEGRNPKITFKNISFELEISINNQFLATNIILNVEMHNIWVTW